MTQLYKHCIPYRVLFLALDDRLPTKAAGAHDRGESVSLQAVA